VITGGNGGSSNQGSVEDMIKAFPAIGFFLVVMAAPIMEELIMRYGIFNIATNRKTAIILSATLFAFMHVITASIANQDAMELLQVFPYFAGGIVFTLGYTMNDDKIAHPMALHATTNCIAFIALMTLPTP
jgi:membrane protease YdiL (CAAX protease family)